MSLTLPPDRLWQRGALGLGVTAIMTTLAWLGWHAPPSPLKLMVAAGSAALVLWLWRQQAATPERQLTWQPAEHHWRLQACAGQIDCLADLGHWMLLRHRGEGQTSWLPVSRCDHATHWHALRCAVFSPDIPVNPPLPRLVD